MQDHEIATLAEQIAQVGRDEMAAVLAQMLADTDPETVPEGYLDGVEDAICALVQAGAHEPR